jgi:hypothetical protein
MQGALTSRAQERRFEDEACWCGNDFSAVLLSDKAFQQHPHFSMSKLKHLAPEEDTHGGAFRNKGTNLLQRRPIKLRGQYYLSNSQRALLFKRATVQPRYDMDFAKSFQNSSGFSNNPETAIQEIASKTVLRETELHNS